MAIVSIAWALTLVPRSDVVLLLCVCVMYRRAQWRAFPFFFAYLSAVAANDAVRSVVGHYFGPIPHFYAYWGTDILNIGLSFLVLYEVLSHVLTSGTIKISRSTFFLIVAILMFTSAALAYATDLRSKDLPVLHAILLTEGMVRFAQIGVLLMFAVLTVFFGFYWGNQAFGISAGFGIYASIMVINTYVRQHSGQADYRRFAATDVSAYLLASLIWLLYAVRQKKISPPSLPIDQASQFEKPLERLIR